VEIALFVDTGRIYLGIPVDTWIRRFLERPGLEAVALGFQAASPSYQLHHLEQREPRRSPSDCYRNRARLRVGHL
jgi:PIN domain nuclease of toxin-antitoxin system